MVAIMVEPDATGVRLSSLFMKHFVVLDRFWRGTLDFKTNNTAFSERGRAACVELCVRGRERHKEDGIEERRTENYVEIIWMSLEQECNIVQQKEEIVAFRCTP